MYDLKLCLSFLNNQDSAEQIIVKTYLWIQDFLWYLCDKIIMMKTWEKRKKVISQKTHHIYSWTKDGHNKKKIQGILLNMTDTFPFSSTEFIFYMYFSENASPGHWWAFHGVSRRFRALKECQTPTNAGKRWLTPTNAGKRRAPKSLIGPRRLPALVGVWRRC